MDKLSTDAERVIKLMTPHMKKYLKDIDQHPPYAFALHRIIPNRIHKNMGKKERKKKFLLELLRNDFIWHFWYMLDGLSITMKQENFIEYYDKYLAE